MRISRPQVLFSALLVAVALAGAASIARAEDGQHSRYMLAYTYGIECQDDRTERLCPN